MVNFFLCFVLFTGTANNAGAILVLGRDLVVVPKLIHPLPPALSTDASSDGGHIEDTWMQVMLKSIKKKYSLYFSFYRNQMFSKSLLVITGA